MSISGGRVKRRRICHERAIQYQTWPRCQDAINRFLIWVSDWVGALLVRSLNENLAGRSGELCQLWTRNCEFSLERWKVFYINHFQKPHLTESDNIGVEDDEAEAEDDSDAEVEPNRRIQLAAEISVKPTRSFVYKKCQRGVGRWDFYCDNILPAGQGWRSRKWKL